MPSRDVSECSQVQWPQAREGGEEKARSASRSLVSWPRTRICTCTLYQPPPLICHPPSCPRLFSIILHLLTREVAVEQSKTSMKYVSIPLASTMKLSGYWWLLKTIWLKGTGTCPAISTMVCGPLPLSVCIEYCKLPCNFVLSVSLSLKFCAVSLCIMRSHLSVPSGSLCPAISGKSRVIYVF